MQALLQLIKYGQSYWLDNLTRRKITSGELKRRVIGQGLRGVTSNPAIFEKAISGGEDYDAQIQRLVREGCEIHEIYERLVVTDIQDACDILRPVYDASDGEDGFVSLEVSPHLVHDTAGTMVEARRLWNAVARPNVCIKIPGTPAGEPAIEEMLYEGININITLLFAIKDYEAVAQAYIRALERRVAEGQPVKYVASVASFFLSRIDVLVDQLLGHRIRPDATRSEAPRAEQLLGQAAIANAKLAYQSFRQIISGDRWRALEERGARVQRPLWASTSTKDPLYDDVRYVEPLIGPHTVNTMPDETIDAFAEHGVIRENSVEADLAQARQTLRDLQTVGVDLDYVAWQLQNEGAQKFIHPYDALMKTLTAKRQKVLGAEASEQTMTLGAVRSAVTSAYPALDSRRFGRRLFVRDSFLWTSDVEQAEAIRHMASRRRRDKVTLVLAEPIRAFGAWAEQLLAESTGKAGKALVPVAGEPLGSPDVYSHDRMFVSVRLARSQDATTERHLASLEEAGYPVVRISLPEALALGGEFFRWEVATATAGAIMGVNPFDEPDVAESKQHTHDLLSGWQGQGVASEGRPMLEADGVAIYVEEKRRESWWEQASSLRDFLQAFVGQVKAPDYLALLSYVQRTPLRHEILQALRGALRNRFKVATTLGDGPRYLHSTGQLHKGGPNTGVFIMFTADAPEDIPVPSQTYGFATLHRAQALGDFLALSHRQRRIIRIHLGSDIDGRLKQIAESLR